MHWELIYVVSDELFNPVRLMKQIPNTFGIEVYARHFFSYRSVEELRTWVTENPKQTPLLHIGAGSNLLFTKDYEGTVLHSEIRYIHLEEEDDTYVTLAVGAGTCWDDLVAYCVSRGWQGVENLSLIPGEVGSAAVQNIGAYGVEIADVLCWVEGVDLWTGDVHRWSREACAYGYRNSLFKQPDMKHYALTEVCLRLCKGGVPCLSYQGLAAELARSGLPPTLQAVRQAVINLRRSKLPDPSHMGNAGSFFTNPVVSKARGEELRRSYPDMPTFPTADGQVKLSGGWLIEQCGWKGRAVGDAAVYEKQALVLVNRGHATGEDIYRLSEEIIQSVEDKFGVRLSREVNVI